MPNLTIELPLHSVKTISEALFFLTETAEVEDEWLVGVRKLDVPDEPLKRRVYAVTFTDFGAEYFAKWLNRDVNQLENDFNGEWSR